jgi:hypothetical protein
MVFMLRRSAEARERLFANDLANSLVEELRGIPFDNVGLDRANGGTELSERYLGQRTFSMEPENDQQGATIFTATFIYGGWGPVGSNVSGGSTSLQGTFDHFISQDGVNWETTRPDPDTGEDVQIFDWDGAYVMITDGDGKGQVARIVSHNATNLTISTDLDPNGGSTGWDIPISAGATFYINNGKTIVVDVTWTDIINGEPVVRRIRRTSLVIPWRAT